MVLPGIVKTLDSPRAVSVSASGEQQHHESRIGTVPADDGDRLVDSETAWLPAPRELSERPTSSSSTTRALPGAPRALQSGFYHTDDPNDIMHSPVVPATAGAGSQIVIDYSQGVVRTGPLNVATSAQSSIPPELLDVVTGARGAMPALPAGARVVSMTRTLTRDGASAPLRYVGTEARGPLTLHHYRAELPTGDIVDLWDYRFQNFDPVFDLGPSLTLAESSLSTAPRARRRS